MMLLLQHAPRNAAGQIICWDNSCWIGCARGKDKCPHAHDVLTSQRGLDWTIVAQLLRRGGLKSGIRVEPNAVDGRVAQLREQAKAEADSELGYNFFFNFNLCGLDRARIYGHLFRFETYLLTRPVHTVGSSIVQLIFKNNTVVR